MAMDYKYITDNNLINKQSYMYSEYGGKDFLTSYFKTRQIIQEEINKIQDNTVHVTYEELLHLLDRIKHNDTEQLAEEDKMLINSYTKAFEVRKRLYSEYDTNWKPIEHSSFEILDNYFLLTECLLETYRISKCTKYVSCLLKIDDTLLSIKNNMTNHQLKRLSQICDKETQIIISLMNIVGVNYNDCK